MPKAKVKWNYANAGDVLLTDLVEADITARGEAVLQEALATAPFESGKYEESLQLDAYSDGSRFKVRIFTDAAHGAIVQVMTNHLAKALRAAGGNSKIN